MKYGLSIEVYKKIEELVKKYSHYQFRLFGSRVKGNYKPNSDIDLAVDGSVLEKDKIQILNDFDLLEIPYMIDIVFCQDITKQELIEAIKKEGILL